MDNEKYMKRCYELAIQAGKKGFDTFGALLVYNGEILEEAENTADWNKGLFGHCIPAALPANAAFARSHPWGLKTSSSVFPMRSFQSLRQTTPFR